MTHQTKIKGYNSMGKLAEDICDLRYDALAELLKAMSEKLFLDCEADEKRGRFQLSDKLWDAHSSVAEAAESIENAWKICKPHMEI